MKDFAWKVVAWVFFYGSIAVLCGGGFLSGVVYQDVSTNFKSCQSTCGNYWQFDKNGECLCLTPK